ncbi:MAG TPA: patatin-like phospholipase family protein, partial [Pseudomonadales bacterium]|nr:patatin-like phospholipase family protein [Pseudomonadales bacterium]
MAALTQHPSSVAQKLQTLRGNRALRLLSDAEIRQQLAGITVPKEADAVFEGGGVKGIALAGAIQVAELLGVRWKSVAGTSAGAIAAALLAAGYSSRELVTILTREMDFNKFMDEGIVDKLPLIGKLASALFEKGIYEGDYFESWLGQKLAQRGVHTFADLRDGQGGYRLKMIASDVTQRKMVVLPDQLPEYGRDPDSFPVARAARMSMSIPYFFEPVMLDYPGASGARC